MISSGPVMTGSGTERASSIEGGPKEDTPIARMSAGFSRIDRVNNYPWVGIEGLRSRNMGKDSCVIMVQEEREV